jgi:hypothetical protein
MVLNILGGWSYPILIHELFIPFRQQEELLDIYKGDYFLF